MLQTSLLFVALLTGNATTPPPADIAPILCGSCAEWNAPYASFQVQDNAYYVGVQGLSSVLIATGDGFILIDGGLPQSAPLIADNIAKLGFRIEDVRWIVSSHAHYDHAGGIAALQRMSGARVAASPLGAAALRAGSAPANDPQAGFGAATRFPPVDTVTELADGATIRLGDVVLTARHTPGHTPGGTTWTWQSCVEKDCLNLVYADSLTAVSAPGFLYSADGGARVAQFERSIAKLRALPCDVLVAAHPGAAQLFEKQLARDNSETQNPLIDRDACKRYADKASAGLARRLAEEVAERDAHP